MEEADKVTKSLREGVCLCQIFVKAFFQSQEGRTLLRRDILFLAFVSKAIGTSEAIEQLDRGPFPEDMMALTRGLAELVINAGYLSFASEEEISRYEDHDVRSNHRLLAQLLQLNPQLEEVLDADARDRFEKKAQDVRAKPDAHSKDTDWSKLDVFARASYVDVKTGLPLCALLHRSVFAKGHPFVHQNFEALRLHVDAMQMGKLNAEAIRKTADAALSGTITALYVLLHLIAAIYDLDLVTELEAVHKILEPFTGE